MIGDWGGGFIKINQLVLLMVIDIRHAFNLFIVLQKKDKHEM